MDLERHFLVELREPQMEWWGEQRWVGSVLMGVDVGSVISRVRERDKRKACIKCHILLLVKGLANEGLEIGRRLVGLINKNDHVRPHTCIDYCLKGTNH